MKLEYKTIITEFGGPSSKGENIERFEVKKDYCCEKMKRACLDEYLDFSEKDEAICLTKTYCYSDDVSYDYYPIDYCPFCKAEIECKEIQKIRRIPKKKTVTKKVTETVYEEKEL